MALDQIDVLLRVIAVLEHFNIAYVIGGSYASSTHGFSRATMDIDLVAAINAKLARTIAAELQPEFYADEQSIERAVKSQRSFNIIHIETGYKFDIFVASTDFHTIQLERRQAKAVRPDDGKMVYVAAPEDIILAKLNWYRRGNEVSEQQWKDVQGVMKVQSGRLDLEYLRQWAGELGVSDLLERAFDEAATQK
jgi:hypothetical protein